MPRLQFRDRDAPPPFESPDWSASDVIYAICYRGIPSRIPPPPLVTPAGLREEGGGMTQAPQGGLANPFGAAIARFREIPGGGGTTEFSG